MSDKPKVQAHLASNLAQLPLAFSSDFYFSYQSAFWETLLREWHGIDRLRLDKFYLLLRMVYRSGFQFMHQHQYNPQVASAYLLLLSNGPLSYYIFFTHFLQSKGAYGTCVSLHSSVSARISIGSSAFPCQCFNPLCARFQTSFDGSSVHAD
jgi:hypothetical protein